MPLYPLVRATLGKSVPGHVCPGTCPHFSGTLGALGSHREAGRLPEAPSPRRRRWEKPG